MRLITISLMLVFVIACGGGSDTQSVAPAPIAPTLPVLSIDESAGVEGTQNDTRLAFSIQLSTASTQIVTVDFMTQDGTATAGEDYVARSDTVEIPIGERSTTIEISIIADTQEESDEQFTVLFSNPQGATLSVPRVNGTIENDDLPQPIFGLVSRPDNQSCFAPPQPSPQSTIAIERVYNELPSFNQPVKLIQEPIVDGRWFVLEKGGLLKVFDYDSPQSVTVFLDLRAQVNTASEGGLLGLAFHPDYPVVPEIFIYYTAPHANPAMRSVVSRWILDNIESPNAAVEQVIIQIDQDFNNHNGGDIGFGNDGLLYIGLGDGGSGGDPNNRAQDTHYLLGSMLRLDVTGPNTSFPEQPYAIPADNPFAQNPQCGPASNPQSCPEIFAWGLRNPYRWSFDSVTGDLWVADVGQSSSEEVNKVELGGNYGWRCEEGFEPFNISGCVDNVLPPLTAYGRSLGTSITGGWVYRGTSIPALQGKYIFADFGSGRIWSLLTDPQGEYLNNELINSANGITSFAPDQNGELYFTNIFDGGLYQLTNASNPPQTEFPEKLSETGCVDMNSQELAKDGTIPYKPRVSFWSDGATKERYMALPNTAQIGFSATDNWQYPEGAVFVKHFRIEQQLIESRLLMRHNNGNWAGYTYQWNSSQTEAIRVIGGKTLTLDNQQYLIPSEDQCLACHTPASGFVLGFSAKQLNHDFRYPQTEITANQISSLAHINIFNPAPTNPLSDLPALVDIADEQIALTTRARSYLDVNCANCHQPGAVVRSTMDLRFSVSFDLTNTCEVAPELGNLGLNNPSIIVPGDSNRSILIERMQRRNADAMPPIGSHLVDQQGVDLISRWIEQMTDCE